MADYDILIAGAGPVGSALAVALADGRRRIAVVDATTTREPPASDRSIALASGSVRLLQALGVWDVLAAQASPIHRVEVSQRGWPGRTRIDAAEEGVVALGRVVGYAALGQALAAHARAAPGVEWFAPAAVEAADAGDAAIQLRLALAAGEREIDSRLAVAAEGTHSPLRGLLGIGVDEHDYEQTALLLDVEAGGEATTAHERFTRAGTLALLPRGGSRRTLVWAQPAATAAHWQAAAPGELRDEVARLLGGELAPVRLAGAPVAYPLKRVEARTLIAARGAVIGNAARTLHPVAAQGFNLALRDACALAERLLPAADPGAPAVLAEWRRARALDRWLTRGFTDALARGLGHGPALLEGPRAGALLGLDLCRGGRHLLAAQTMGLASGLPRVGTWRPEGAA